MILVTVKTELTDLKGREGEAPSEWERLHLSNPSQLGPLFAIYVSSNEGKKKTQKTDNCGRWRSKENVTNLLHEHGDIFVWP